MRCLRRGFRQRDRLIEGGAGFLLAIELHEKGSPCATVIEVAGKFRGERFDHLKRSGRSPDFADGNGSVELHDGRWLHSVESRIQRLDFRPISVLRLLRASM